MLRVPVGRAKPGMVLARAVFDVRGEPIFQQGDGLTEDNLGRLGEAGSVEVLVEDARLDDVLVASLFSAELEARAVYAVHNLLSPKPGSEQISREELIGIRIAVRDMMRRLFPFVLGEPDLSGVTGAAYTFLHPVRAAGLSLLIGRLAGYSVEELFDLGLAAILENVGYLRLSRRTLDQAGIALPVMGLATDGSAAFAADGEPLALQETERNEMRKHPERGAALIAGRGLSQRLLTAIEQHHEQWDGSGYPRGLRGEEISPFARIIAIADTFHALLSKRPQRKAMVPHEAVEFIAARAGTSFDPDLTRLFVQQVPQYPAGLAVRLNTGDIGVVIDANVGYIGRPVVRIFGGGDTGARIDIDLSGPQYRALKVVEVQV